MPRALREAGIHVLSSCQEGTCGTTLPSGRVDHRDSLLTPEEQAASRTTVVCVYPAACPTPVLER